MSTVSYKLSMNNLHIIDSYKVRKWSMRKELKAIKKENPADSTIVFDRSFFSLKMEWIFHNFLYEVGIERDRTKDVDLDNPCDHDELLYIIAGLLTWIVVW